MDLLIILLVMVLLLLLKGFFSGSEIALVNSDKLKMHHKAKQGNRGAQLVLKLFETPDVLLGTTLVGTNIATVVLTTLGTMLMIRSFGQLGDLYAVLLFTPLFLVLGEIVPKSVFQQKSNEIAPMIVYPLRVFSFLFYPLVFVFSRVARLCARLVGGGKTEQTVFITREQMRMVVDRLDNRLVDFEIEFRRKANAAQHAHRIFAHAHLRIADQDNTPVPDIIEPTRVVPDAEIGNVVVQRVAGEIPAPDIFVNGAVDVVAQDSSLIVTVVIVVFADRRSAKCCNLDNLASEAHVRESEAAPDKPAIAEQCLDLFGCGVGCDIKVLGMKLQHRIAHTTTNQESLVARLVESV